jgi:peptide deformylase
MIITDENKLREKCTDVLPEEIQIIKLSLEKELTESNNRGVQGLGLAAPQIGISKRMAIVRVPGASNRLYTVDLVNAFIEKSYDLDFFNGEGCLSFPGVIKKTRRYGEIVVINVVEPFKFIATGLFAVVIQHEIDHTNGILLPDIAIK